MVYEIQLLDAQNFFFFSLAWLISLQSDDRNEEVGGEPPPVGPTVGAQTETKEYKKEQVRVLVCISLIYSYSFSSLTCVTFSGLHY